MEELLFKSDNEKIDSELLNKVVIKLMKQSIFERFIESRTLSADDQEFCDKIDWHPVDELPLKKEFVEELIKSSKKPHGKAMTIDEFNKRCESL